MCNDLCVCCGRGRPFYRHLAGTRLGKIQWQVTGPEEAGATQVFVGAIARGVNAPGKLPRWNLAVDSEGLSEPGASPGLRCRCLPPQDPDREA